MSGHQHVKWPVSLAQAGQCGSLSQVRWRETNTHKNINLDGSCTDYVIDAIRSLWFLLIRTLQSLAASL